MGSVLQSFLLPVLFFFTSKSLRPRSDLSSWKKGLNWSSLHRKVSTQELVLLLPVEWSLLQSLLCCHSSGGKGRVKICKTVVTSGEPESREWVALFCFHWKWRELISSWHSSCYQKDQKFTSQNSLETREKKCFVNQCVRFAAEWWKPRGKVFVLEAAWPGHALRLTFMAVS